MIFFVIPILLVTSVWLLWRFGLDGDRNLPPAPPEDYDPTQDVPIWWKNRK